MKVELSIADDRELRTAIRDMIKGEVTAIMRGEIKTIIAELVKEGAFPKDVNDLKGMVEAEVAKYVKGVLMEKQNYFGQKKIETMAERVMIKIVQEALASKK